MYGSLSCMRRDNTPLCISVHTLAEESDMDATILISQALIGQRNSAPNQRSRTCEPSTGVKPRILRMYPIWLERDEIKSFFFFLFSAGGHYICEMLTFRHHILCIVSYLSFIPNWLFLFFLPNATLHLTSPLRNRQIVQVPLRCVCVDFCKPRWKKTTRHFGQANCPRRWTGCSSVIRVSLITPFMHLQNKQ